MTTALLLSSVLAAAGCGGAPHTATQMVAPQAAAAELALGPLGFVPGEAMSFEVKVGGILAGEAALAVGEPGEVEGVRAVTVRSRLASAGAFALVKTIVDESTTVIDAATARPLQLSADVAYDEARYHADARFAGPKVAIEIQRPNGKLMRQQVDFGQAIAHDAHSAMAAIRSWRADPGAARTLWVISGRRLWRSDLAFTGRETLGTHSGNVATLRLDGIAYRLKADHTVDESKEPRPFTVWMSDDADRVPLRVQAQTEFGAVTIDLVDYQRP